MTDPEGNSEFCFPRVSMFPETKHFVGNTELFPVCRHSFRSVARSWHLAVNSSTVRCHVTMKPMNGRAVAGKTPDITITMLFPDWHNSAKYI